MINKKQETQLLSWKPTWENHQYFVLLQNYIYKQFLPTTPDKDGTTPYLPKTTERRLRPPGLSATTERMILHPNY